MSRVDMIKVPFPVLFSNRERRKEFARMAGTDEYIKEAYRELEKMSADEKARLEYEAREKAIRDYNSQINSALRRGEEEGRRSVLMRMLENGLSPEEIMRLSGAAQKEVGDAEKRLRDLTGIKCRN